MAVDATKVLVGAPDQAITGAILSAPLGTTLPLSAVDTLDPAFQGSGYVSSDGVELAPEYSTADITDWSGALVRRLLESFNGSISWAHLEWNEDSLRNAFGDDNVVVTAATETHGKQITVGIGASLPAPKTWAFKMKDGKTRILIDCPNAQVTTVDTITFAANAPITLPVTLSCYPGPDGKSIHIHTDDGVFSA